MKRDVIKEIENLEDWLKLNKNQISIYLPKEDINHRGIRASQVIDNIIKAIKKGDISAIELGCDLVLLNKHIPFGRTLKGNIFSSLKAQAKYISSEYKEKLTNLATVYINLPYPPRESKELFKLLSKFEQKYRFKVLENTHSSTTEAKKWVNYLETRYQDR